MSDPSLHDVSHFVRSWTGIGSETSIDADTLLEADLGVTGHDGDELLKAAEKVFGVSLSNPDDGYRTTFSLSANEYLFSSEGLDLLGIGALVRRLLRIPGHAVRDLTVGQLHAVIARSAASAGAA